MKKVNINRKVFHLQTRGCGRKLLLEDCRGSRVGFLEMELEKF